MTASCPDLIQFVDGELDDAQARAFRTHLKTCPGCQHELVFAMQLRARLDALGVPAPDASAATALALPGHAAEATDPAPRRLTLDLTAPRGGGWRRRFLPRAVAAVAFSALALAALVLSHRPEANPLREAMTRPLEMRFAHPDAGAYKPYGGAIRGDDSPAPRGATPPAPRDRFTRATLAALEQRDRYGAALAMAWEGVPSHDIVAELDELPKTFAIAHDRLVVAHDKVSPDNLEPALAELERLQRNSDVTVARAARWNYAILLTRLDLSFTGARAFRTIAAEGEPGWWSEAVGRAVKEDSRTPVAWAIWARARAEGEALLQTGAPVSAASLQACPGLMRAYLYNAVRSAPSRARVLALTAMATALDLVDPHPVLRDYVARVAELDFARRRPLAEAYARLLADAPVSAEQRAALTTAAPTVHTADIVLGAQIQLDGAPAQLEQARTVARQGDDPWFDIILAKARAARAIRDGRWLDAEVDLQQGKRACTAAIAYQCLDLEAQLAQLYQELQRLPDALTVLRKAIEGANDAREQGRHRQLLRQLADLEVFGGSPARARAYANEVLAMPGVNDAYRRSCHLILASAAVLDLDGKTARRELREALALGPPEVTAENLLVDIARLDPQADDATELERWLGATLADPATSAAHRAFAEEIEGRLTIARDPGAATALLERAIAAAEADPGDPGMQRTRAGAYSVLVLDAARRGEPALAVTWAARELGLAAPTACAVVVAAEDERAAVVVRGADGRDHGSYLANRNPTDGAVAIPDAFARALAGCGHVAVLARSTQQGLPHVLPPELPWSYATDPRGRKPQPAHAALPARTLVITEVTPPAYLDLPTLARTTIAPSAVTLRSTEATPGRVLAEMASATEIQFHTHARVDVAISDASHLVLSPEPSGRYALTAEAIRGVALRGHPVVVLAACHSSQGARYEHAPWNLPDAFLAAGARAVFGVGTELPDLEAGPFFDQVLARVRAGVDPAVALRDARVAALAAAPGSWVRDVILFE